jgi:hypothetical protein
MDKISSRTVSGTTTSPGKVKPFPTSSAAVNRRVWKSSHVRDMLGHRRTIVPSDPAAGDLSPLPPSPSARWAPLMFPMPSKRRLQFNCNLHTHVKTIHTYILSIYSKVRNKYRPLTHNLPFHHRHTDSETKWCYVIYKCEMILNYTTM